MGKDDKENKVMSEHYSDLVYGKENKGIISALKQFLPKGSSKGKNSSIVDNTFDSLYQEENSPASKPWNRLKYSMSNIKNGDGKGR